MSDAMDLSFDAFQINPWIRQIVHLQTGITAHTHELQTRSDTFGTLVLTRLNGYPLDTAVGIASAGMRHLRARLEATWWNSEA